ncbi:bifunctional precorrin-2 dehydrogenase/sirohydrochlorin ferrochelatase, partial [bacterium]|nr:bifunctional precorrin-2 dehydrogenase/sirohydrochlorin ferrochelatase [bacterium]
MDYLPIMLRLQDQKVLVVGGGQVATRKVAMLLRAGAGVRLVADTVDPALAQTLSESPHEVLHTRFQPEHIDGVRLVVAATNDNAVNLQVYEESRQRCVPVNVVDNPALCDFIFPSIVDRSPVIVAVSSGGNSPVLARLLRSRLETY